MIGTAPSAELLSTWNEREIGLINQPANVNAVPPVAFAPNATGAYVGQDGIPPEVMEKIAREGARTIPGREHGGNCDVSLRRFNSLIKLSLVDQELVAVSGNHIQRQTAEIIAGDLGATSPSSWKVLIYLSGISTFHRYVDTKISHHLLQCFG